MCLCGRVAAHIYNIIAKIRVRSNVNHMYLSMEKKDFLYYLLNSIENAIHSTSTVKRH